MAMQPNPGGRNRGKGIKTGEEQLRETFEEVSKWIPPYPQCDVKVSYAVEGTGGAVVKIVAISSIAILAAIGLYGMVVDDQGILLAVLDAAKAAMLGVGAWGIGRIGTAWLTRGRKDNEKDQGSG